MKKMKVFYGGKRLKDIYPGATRWEVMKYRTAQFMRKVFIVMVGTALTTIIFIIMRAEFVAREIEKIRNEQAPIVESIKELPPVMKRILVCESGGKQFGKNGQVITNGNSNGSVDLGIAQINLSIWGAKATELGYDLSKEEDNIAFAMYLYENNGTEPWIWSKKCWN